MEPFATQINFKKMIITLVSGWVVLLGGILLQAFLITPDSRIGRWAYPAYGVALAILVVSWVLGLLS